jgi:amidase
MGGAFPAEVPAVARLTGLRIGIGLSELFQKYDALVVPTLGRAPVSLDEAQPKSGDQQLMRFLVSPAGSRLLRVPRLRETVMETQLERLKRQVMHRTMVANLTGIPAMSMPLHRTENDLPVGVQFLGRFGDEATLLRLAAQLEKAKPWRVRS